MLDAVARSRHRCARQDVGQPRFAPTPGGSRPGWCVVEAYARREQHVSERLSQQHFEAYLPLRFTPKGPRPLFPAYLFLWLDHDTPWRSVLYTHGVYDLIRSKETGIPIPCPSGVVEAIQAGETLRRTLAPTDRLWRPGAACRLNGGAFHGQDAVVMEIGKHNAIVALMLFGHIRNMCVSMDCLIMRDDG